LHGPSEELQLALGELRRRAIGGGVVVIRHFEECCFAWMLIAICWCRKRGKEDVGRSVGVGYE
jgi:hypothetical protein